MEDTTRAPLSRKTKGVLMMVGGAVLIPVGLGVAVINSIEKCDPEMPGFGPCSDTEPNEAVATGGYVAAGGGLMLFLAGLLTLVTD